MNLRWAVTIGIVAAGCAAAAPIGVLGIGSSGAVEATLTSILFTPDPGALPDGICPGVLCWNGDVNTGTTLTFAGGPLTTQEGILINGGVPFGSPPPSEAGVVNPFLRFADHPFLLFNLVGVSPGSPNQNCAAVLDTGSCSIDVAGTPSPVVLTRLGTNTLVSISFFGIATDGTGSSNWTGTFSATIPDTLPIDILSEFCGLDLTCSAEDVEAGTAVTVPSVSGSFSANAVVPEPGTISLILGGIAFMLLGLFRRKKIV